MNNLTLFIICVSSTLIFGCSDKSPVTAKKSKTYVSEIITKTFSVKKVNAVVERDTVNMMQSITYDKSGRAVSNIFYQLDGSVSWKDQYEYNEQGYKIGSNYFEGDKLTIRYEYDLDELGRKIAFRALDIKTDTLLYDGASRYENEGLLRKDGYINKKGIFKWNLEYTFDQTGKELSYVYIDLSSGQRFPSTYEYTKFNKEGEWTERKIIENGETQGIELRIFKYSKNAHNPPEYPNQ